jgi:hypothetical protein
MAHTAVRRVRELELGCILAPERYDPRTNPIDLTGHEQDGQRIDELAATAREALVPQRASKSDNYLILDTGDAHHGFVSLASKGCVNSSGIGSVKKILQPGDVIISRLRPYLRQVAWVDSALTKHFGEGKIVVAASTEFYILRPSKGEQSLAFLVPFLLSPHIQGILAASQEGGHHPRFSEKTLLNLMVPERVLSQRVQLSACVEAAITIARQSEIDFRKSVAAVSELLNGSDISSER